MSDETNKDSLRRAHAEMSLANSKDVARQLDAAEKEASLVLTPIKDRGKRNQFLAEAKALLERQRKT